MTSKPAGKGIALVGLRATTSGLYVEPPANHPIYTRIGMVAHQWSILEHYLDITIWHLLGTEHILGACLTAQIGGVHNRVAALKTLIAVRNLDTKFIGKLDEFATKCHDPQERRNRIVHDPWYLDLKTMTPAQWKSLPRKDLHFGMKHIDETYVTDTLEMIPKCSARARELNEKIYDALQASLKKPGEPPPATHQQDHP